MGRGGPAWDEGWRSLKKRGPVQLSEPWMCLRRSISWLVERKCGRLSKTRASPWPPWTPFKRARSKERERLFFFFLWSTLSSKEVLFSLLFSSDQRGGGDGVRVPQAVVVDLLGRRRLVKAVLHGCVAPPALSIAHVSLVDDRRSSDVVIFILVALHISSSILVALHIYIYGIQSASVAHLGRGGRGRRRRRRLGVALVGLSSSFAPRSFHRGRGRLVGDPAQNRVSQTQSSHQSVGLR
jgi:hypothetical protein